ncbi:sensor histidine kinase [Agaribacterium haliotis]|uniref:sensor histidine kinase n=1 Tax=Agaribacterium haliotis TaxID=2013869 RepID=UPI000BB58C3F|nr:ATP-binding protein [Agaribacterium haliotis]
MINNTQWQLWRFVGLRRSLLLALAALCPPLIACAALLCLGNYDWLEVTTVLLLVVVPSALAVGAFWFSVFRPWQAVANILMGFREDDYSLRSAVDNSKDVVNVVLRELNAIADYLSSSRSSAYESQKLLSRILAEVDVAVFLFDNHKHLVMANRYACKLYGLTEARLIGQSVDDLGLSFAQLAAHTSAHEHGFPKYKSRWLVKHSAYRQQGLPYQFILLADIGVNLREEELDAWRKLIRILSHEINNALTPMKTTTGSMARILPRTDSYPDWKVDFSEGLEIIDERVDNLNRMVSSYAKLARLPEPQKQMMALRPLLQRLYETYKDKGLQLLTENELSFEADPAQLEQVLVNLIKNALEASDRGKPIELSWRREPHSVEISLRDFGQGIDNPDNLFIPYFTTKSEGSGIGLVLSRQIIEAHGGQLQLQNSDSGPGCLASIRLPLR